MKTETEFLNLICWFALSWVLVLGAVSCSADGVQEIGTPESHQLIWRNHAEANKLRLDTRRTLTENSQKIDELEARIKELLAHLDDDITVAKDEFETTNEWRARYAGINNKRKKEVTDRIEDCKQQISQLKARSDSIENASQSARTQETVELSAEVTFFVRVDMGQYDADNQTISGFKMDSHYRVEGNPTFVVVDGAGDNQVIFDYDAGSTFNGLTIPREKAKALRNADDTRDLWISFKAKPKPIQFSDGYDVKNVPHTETVENHGLIDSPGTVAARLFVSALGGDPGAIEEKPQTKTTYRDEWKKAKIIRTGWEGTPTPQAFYHFDKDTGRLELIP
jgi:hypothetical protein